MARGDLLRSLFAGYARGDDAAFRSAALDIVAEEREKKHYHLARELERAVASERRSPRTPPTALQPLPKGRDDRPLLRLSKPEHEVDELVLPDHVRSVLDEVIRENLHRAALTSHALRPRQRLLLIGPPGTGKSAAAHGIAAALSLPVATASLAALSSSFLGDTARNIEAVVRFAERTPCVLVFDEFDVIGQERAQPGDHGEMRRVAATVLQLMDDSAGESLMVATSNHPQAVDSAAWRRFDEVIGFEYLDARQTADLITFKLRTLPSSISPRTWAQRMSGFSPADVELTCIDALRRAILDERTRVDDAAMTAAVERFTARTIAMSTHVASRES